MQKNLFGMWKMAEMRQKAYEAATPIYAVFELTPRCGFNCRMCYVHLAPEQIPQVGNGRELTGKEWLEIGAQAAEMGVLSLCITGGDPILHPDFPEIWRGLSQMGFQMTLQTNAAWLTQELLELLDEYPPEMVKITLYGASDQTYQNVCRTPQGFTKTDAGIQALKARGHRIQLVTTFIKQNQEDAGQIAAYARENQLPWYYSAACYPSLRGAESEAAQCAIEIWAPKAAKETSKRWNEIKPMQDETLPCELCSSYRTEFHIQWDGNMGFCSFLDEPRIQAVGSNLEECWQELLKFWTALRWPEECYSCDYRGACRRCLAHLACLSGGLNQVEQQYCQHIKQLIDMEKRGKE